MTIKICLITSSRAEYDRQYWLIKDLFNESQIDLQIIVTGMHLSKKFGYSIEEIEKDGFFIADKVEMLASSDKKVDITKSIGIGTMKLSDSLERLKPDLVLVYGDRFELLMVMSVCVCMGIPIAHIGGGQITEGAIDDQIRHMLTKASHLHFTANQIFAERLINMGEESWRICVSGSPAVDSIKRLDLLSCEKLEEHLNLNLSIKTALVTFHPVTLDLEHLHFQMNNLVEALREANRKYGIQYVITYPNADSGSYYIIEILEKFFKSNPNFVKLKKNLGQLYYLSLLSHVNMIIGNSSSGIIESPSFGIPAINIGDRQKGRIFTDNIIQVDYDKKSILEGIEKGLDLGKMKCKNPYGDGKASSRIINYIKSIFNTVSFDKILKKKFVDL